MHAPTVMIGTMGVWLLLVVVLQLRSRAGADERLYGLTTAAPRRRWPSSRPATWRRTRTPWSSAPSPRRGGGAGPGPPACPPWPHR
ncbi:hypothetical protein [Streptomyces thioluteus]|uniref:hypothetical protein n=1 Tax=Streptomyces thioluteus TaxID=66431 RepID=UPI0031E6B294